MTGVLLGVVGATVGVAVAWNGVAVKVGAIVGAAVCEGEGLAGGL